MYHCRRHCHGNEILRLWRQDAWRGRQHHPPDDRRARKPRSYLRWSRRFCACTSAEEFVKNKWCKKILLPSEYAQRKTGGENVIVVGGFSERCAEAIYTRPERAIFINPFDMARPGQIRDGYFPDAIFADPRYIVPVLYRTLNEWLTGERATIASLIEEPRVLAA